MTANNQSNFQNEHIQVELKKDPGCKITLDVTVSPEATKASYKKAVDVIRKEVSIPGFRKGKAPDDMILEKYATYIDKEWKDILLNTSFEEATRLTKTYLFNRNSLKAAHVKSASKENGATMHYEFEAGPDIPTISPETVTIKDVKLQPVTQKEIDKTIEDLTLQSAEWKEITDRGVQEGDHVIIDIDDIGEDPKNLCTDTTFHVRKGQMGEWMRKLLIGMKPEETSEGMSEKDLHNEDCNECKDGTHEHAHHEHFIPTLCRIMLHRIREATPHPLDDALAKKYGASSVSDLQEKVKLSLERRAQEEQQDHKRHLMEVELLKNYPFDMPSSLVQTELKAFKKAYMDNLRNQGVKESEILAQANEAEKEIAKKYDRDFRLYFLTQKYATDHNLTVSKDEISMEVMRQMFLQRMGKNTVDTTRDPQELQVQVEMQLVAAKAIDQMVEKSNKM